MKSVTEDRRTRKTKAAIESAFAELIQKRDINKISIKDITDKADTNRSTFYTHYRDIYDLLKVLEDKLIAGVSVFVKPLPYENEKMQRGITESLQYIIDNHEIFTAIVNSSQGNAFLGRLTDVVGHRLMTFVDGLPDNEMIVSFYKYGATSVIREWIGSGSYQSFSAAQMSEFLENTIRVGIQAFNRDTRKKEGNFDGMNSINLIRS